MVYLVPGLYSGLTNQLFSFYASALFAQQQNWTLVLPYWIIDFKDFQKARSLPFSYFLRFSSEPNSFKIARYLPREYFSSCLGQLQCSSSFSDCQYPSLQIMKQYAVNHGVVCLSAHTTYFGLQRILKIDQNLDTFVSAPGLVEIRSLLQTSPLFQNITLNIKNKLSALYGTTNYVSLHARIEDDFVHACKVWKREGRTDGSNTQDQLRVCLEGDDAFFRALKMHAPNNSIVMIMSGVTNNLQDKFPLTCGGRCGGGRDCFVFRCISKDSLISHIPQTFLKTLTAFAMLDFSIALESTVFIGNLYSSMSSEIYTKHRLKNKPSFFVNRKCSEINGKCP